MHGSVRRLTASCCSVAGGTLAVPGMEAAVESRSDGPTVRHVRSADGVEIAYVVAGSGSTALLFIHGGLADRSFRAPQVAGLADGFRVVALDLAAAFRGAGVPIRAISGDLRPTHTDLDRTLVAGFDAVVMKGCGHYPTLERPAEFNLLLTDLVHDLEDRADRAR
jgi:pimeloyl-ACP methyl ester carboxylesterase